MFPFRQLPDSLPQLCTKKLVHTHRNLELRAAWLLRQRPPASDFVTGSHQEHRGGHCKTKRCHVGVAELTGADRRCLRSTANQKREKEEEREGRGGEERDQTSQHNDSFNPSIKISFNSKGSLTYAGQSNLCFGCKVY